jgi:hypothetical protein
MSGLLRSLILGDLGNWSHTAEVEKRTELLEGHLQLKRRLDQEQTLSIFELELAFAGLLARLREKNLLSDTDINGLVEDAEVRAKELLDMKNRHVNASIRD